MPTDPRDDQALIRIGQNIRRWRRGLDQSQDAVAFRSGLSNQSVVSKLETGQRESGVLKYIRAAVALDMPLTELFKGVEDLYR
jgi:transcriptional regulator with XRE-family HTH domain